LFEAFAQFELLGHFEGALFGLGDVVEPGIEEEVISEGQVAVQPSAMSDDTDLLAQGGEVAFAV
jgi:hypothetical protein